MAGQISIEEYMESIQKPEKPITVNHPNGYVGVLYDESSMKILKDGKLVIQTFFAKPETAAELYEELEYMPEFMAAIDKQRRR